MGQIVIVTAVRPETRAVLRAVEHPAREPAGRQTSWRGRAGGRDVAVIEVGVGATSARRAMSAAVPTADLLISTGFAGALVAGMLPGTLARCRRVVWDDPDGARQTYEVPPSLLAAAAAALAAVPFEDALLSSPVIVDTEAAKLCAGRRYGAVAVEMETAALIGWARPHAVPVLPLRVILDPAELSLARLPKNLATSWRARAQSLGSPATWCLLATLRQHAAIASATLQRVVAAVLRAPALVPTGRPSATCEPRVR